MSNTREAVQLDRIRNNIDAAYIALEALGITVPEGATVDELAALINDAAAAHLDDVITKRIVQTTGTATDKVMSQAAVTEAIEAAAVNENAPPDYWLDELETKADAIRQAAEAAGRNKSTFLWYTDAHWQTSARVSPALLHYLRKNTPVNRINFGGDIVNDPSAFTHDNIKYVYEWRSKIADLPNHHSVFGNHDVNQWAADATNTAYALLLAPEESSDMVVGGESCYYIDSPAERTRYLYLPFPSTDINIMLEYGKFVADALKSTSEGWHIVGIAHRWLNYSDAAKPTEGSLPLWETDVLSVFDAYNARQKRNGSNYFYAQDFTDCAGKVEFCIGGHIHVDHDFESDGGIPVIITAPDTNQERVPSRDDDSGTVGTITEAAVYGIIADYNNTENTKITVVGVGRGTSRVIGGEAAPDEPVNLFDKNDPDVLDTGRFNSSNNAVAYAAGQLVTGYIKAQVGDTFTVKTDKDLNTSVYTCDAMMYKADKSVLDNLNAATTTWELSADGLTGVFTLPATYPNWSVTFETTAYVRFCVAYNDINNITITKA